MAFTCSGRTPRAGALGVAGIITDSRQLRGRGLRAFKGLKCGEKKPPLGSLGPPPPASAFFVLRFVPPSSCTNIRATRALLIEDSSVLETTRKRLAECDLASPFVRPTLLCVRLQWVLVPGKGVGHGFVCSWVFFSFSGSG